MSKHINLYTENMQRLFLRVRKRICDIRNRKEF